MSTHSKVLGSGLRGSPDIPGNQDPSGYRGELSPLQDHRPNLEEAPRNSARDSRRLAGQSTGAYTMIPPNENRRNQIKRIAEQELANLERWREENRAKPVYLVPTQLGGSQGEKEVRQRQQLQLMQSKYQLKLKREESARIRKEAEEAELQKMKAVQREKSNKLEEKKRLQEKLRREAYREHQQRKTAEFLSTLDTGLPDRSASQIAPCDPPSSTWSELLELKRQQQEEERARMHQSEQRRVNNAFLDRLQGKSQAGGLGQAAGCWNTNSGNSWGE
ncbi:epithelial-stromal interaction protein 1 isoform X2 [Ochotona princeps]|uniref:epithelial-stromal interaction protein 1 isoform X2 n=1 Tax=Ochotona princeps TaxID=9978 RepID=UPI00271550AD|nr:epithelial-stromal interaction protein 1 isoform X2 [Ochotona princeps]